MERSEGMVASPPPAEGSESSKPPPPPPPSQPQAAPVASAGGEEKASQIGDAMAASVAASPAGAVAGLASPEAGAGAGAAQAGVGSGVVDPMKKKRGRPRKYAPDGSLVRPLNATPISASVPGGVQYTPAASVGAAMKRGRGRPVGLVSKSPRYGLEFESLGRSGPPENPYILKSIDAGEIVAAGANFTPHIITVASGEDVTMKIISFSQQGPQAICILSANGIISNVTLRQPDSSGGTLTYEGRFELLSLSGSFMPNENGGTKSRSGGLSVSLASPDGRVVGGGVAGQLVAAGPVQVVVGSFLPSYQMEQKVKKQKLDTGSASMPTPALHVSHPEMEETSGRTQPRHNSAAAGKSDLSTASSLRGEDWPAHRRPVPGTQNSTDINISLPAA